MEMLKASAAAACLLGIIFAVAEHMLPSEKFSRQINMIFSLIMVLVVVKPFVGADFDMPELSGNTAVPEDYSARTERLLEKEIRSNICDSIENRLVIAGINPLEITVDINNSADGSICINRVVVLLTDDEKTAEAEQIVSDALGDTAEITVKTAEE